jgi:hypothetical protein
MGAKNQQKPVSGALHVLAYPIEGDWPLQKSVGPALAATLGRGSVHALGWHISVRNGGRNRCSISHAPLLSYEGDYIRRIIRILERVSHRCPTIGT